MRLEELLPFIRLREWLQTYAMVRRAPCNYFTAYADHADRRAVLPIVVFLLSERRGGRGQVIISKLTGELGELQPPGIALMFP